MLESPMAESDFSLYLTHSDEDKGWQMVCTDVGRTRIAPGSPYPPRSEDHPAGFRSVSVGRRINEFQMVYILDGRGQLHMEDRGYDVEAGSVFLLFPDVPHSYRPDMTTGWTEFWVGFAGAQVDALVNAGIISPNRPVLHPGYQASLLGGFQSVFHHVKVQSPLYQFRVCAEILGLLAETLSLERLAVQQTHAQEVVELAKAFIGTHVQQAFDLEELATAVHQTIPRLNELFKDYTGMTPYQYCIHTKINRAKEILTAGESSVKEIAWKVGFDDPYYFSRLFKKKTGVSPSLWTGET